MKRIALILACLTALTRGASAMEFHMGEGTNALTIGADVVFAEEAICIANGLDVQGQAQKDLWLLASADIQFQGKAQGDLRLASRAAVINGIAHENLLAYANGLQLTTNSVVQGEALLFGNTVICEGIVEGNARIIAPSAALGGRWAGNVHVQANEIRIAPDTQIAGNLKYSCPTPLVYPPSVQIAGTVEEQPLLPARQSWSNQLVLNGYFFLAALLVGMPFVGFFPLYVGKTVRTLRTSPFRSFMVGAITLLFGPFLIVFLFLSAIGMPLAFILGAFYASLAYLSHIVVALWIGHLFLRPAGPASFARVLSTLAAGLFVIYFIAALPGVAPYLFPLIILPGMGALLIATRQSAVWAMPMPPRSAPPPMPPQSEDPSSNQS